MHGMLVAPQPAAVEAGARALMEGGNAIDAAVTCALTQMVVSPQMCGLGGYLLLTAHIVSPGHTGKVVYLDAPATAGSRAAPDMWQDRYLRPNPDGWGFFLRDKVNDVGYQSICTPGTVRGLAAILGRWGTFSFPHAAEPAARLAEEGFVVDSHLAAGWRARAAHPEASSLLDCIQANPEARRIYLHENGRPYDTGEVLRNPDYARSLRAAAADPEGFYTGELARTMAEDLQAHDALVTAEDLAGYHLHDLRPLMGEYRGYRLATSRPPHGGPTLLAALHILEGYDLRALGHNTPEYIYLVAMAMKAAFADRNVTLGDPDYVDVPVEWMTSTARAAEWRRVIDAGERIQVSLGPSAPPDTTHVSVVDERGNAVALTHSLGSSSGVITPGLGFMYNNSMVNYDPLPGHPNSIAAGKARTTGMAPTIVYQGDQPVIVIGSPGATHIITSNLQVLLNVLDFGMSMSDAVLAPRFDCQGDLIRCQARIPEYVCEQVRRRHPIERMPVSHGGMALVHAIRRDPASGRLEGGADTGSGGMALEV
ncbi:MAG: gamma-glutamyltransferase family protein [Anaerolineae bacterium]